MVSLAAHQGDAKADMIEQGPFAGYKVVECGDHFHVTNVNDKKDYGAFPDPVKAIAHIMFLLYGMPENLRGEEITQWTDEYANRKLH